MSSPPVLKLAVLLRSYERFSIFYWQSEHEWTLVVPLPASIEKEQHYCNIATPKKRNPSCTSPTSFEILQYGSEKWILVVPLPASIKKGATLL